MTDEMIEFFKFFQLPQASTFAANVDALYDFIHWFSVLSFLGIVTGFVWFSIKYHQSRVDPKKTAYIEGHLPSEIGVMAVLFIVVMVIFFWGWTDYKKMLEVPKDALEVNVMGRQWMWEMEYANGRKLTNELVVPRDKPVKLVMTSADVLHSFFVPDFRVKQDVIPNVYTKLWFTATEEGEHQIFCAEYCGTAHSQMLANIKVLEPKEYERWQLAWELDQRLGISEAGAAQPDGAGGQSPAERGKELFAAKGCTACHTTTGQKLVGPSMKGIFGMEEELEGGAKAVADENYLRESLTEPAVKLVKGFPPVMPPFKGTLSDEEINALIAYIKSLGGKNP